MACGLAAALRRLTDRRLDVCSTGLVKIRGMARRPVPGTPCQPLLWFRAFDQDGYSRDRLFRLKRFKFDSQYLCLAAPRRVCGNAAQGRSRLADVEGGRRKDCGPVIAARYANV